MKENCDRETKGNNAILTQRERERANAKNEIPTEAQRAHIYFSQFFIFRFVFIVEGAAVLSYGSATSRWMSVGGIIFEKLWNHILSGKNFPKNRNKPWPVINFLFHHYWIL